ncbi:MAG: hypothetical protein AAF152_06670 [Cyanobacteria bacterium P01_A01_bin.114]
MESLNRTGPNSVYQNAPIASFLSETLEFSAVRFAVTTSLVLTGLALMVGWISGTLGPLANHRGLLQDWVPWIAILLVNPIVFGYYLWSFQSIRHVMEQLEASDVVETSPQEIHQTILRGYRQWWRRPTALGSATAFSVFVGVTRRQLSQSWSSSTPLTVAATVVLTFVVVYAGSVLILNLISNIQILQTTFKYKDLTISPLHPDRCGGLNALSDYALKTAYLVAILGIWVGIVEYQFIQQNSQGSIWFVYPLIPLYLGLSVICFYGPLLTAHRGMKKAKQDLLHQIAHQFNCDYGQIYGELAADAETLQRGTEKIKELRALYELTDEFPIWPFNIAIFRQYLLTASTPIVPIVLGLLQNFVGQWLDIDFSSLGL